jgi:GntR family transcriptional regulator/MocR family aminotransferase
MTTELRGISNVIAVNRRGPAPLYQQIYDAFRRRVLAGDLRAGELVPSTRALARDLRISRLPVLNAYAQLHAEGYFESRVGAGTFIAASLSHAPRVRANVHGQRRISSNAAALPPYQRPVWADKLGPFEIGQPDLQSFPIEIWSRLVARHARRMRVKALHYGDPMGLPELREAIATYLRTSRSVRCDADQILIVSGSQQGLDLAARVLLNAGDPVWVEEPGYWLALQVLKASGCEAVPVAVDAEGLSVAAGVKRNPNARAVFVTPSHQYPLGVTMSVARRLQLLAWAERAAAWIVEDDYDSEYRYDSMPIASLQGLDRNDRVIYIGTFSKVMFPSLRLGYVVVPPDLVERFTAMRTAMDLGPSHATQAVMSDFIREGHFARHIRRMRPVYAERRRVLTAEIECQLGDRARIAGDAAGMHLTILIDGLRNDRAIARKAGEQSMWLSALSHSYLSTPAQGFVLGFGNAKASQIPAAVRHLRNLLEEK